MFPANAPCRLRAGQVLNRKYQITEELGAGGFGCVYAALNLNLGTRVALKLRRSPGPDARIWREAKLAAALRSPYSVRIFDVDRLEDGTPYIVMEFLEGQTVRDYLRQHEKANFEQAIRWSLQVCTALREAHASGLVHRDIKPSNLFLVGNSNVDIHVKLVDFGLARALDDASVDTVTDSGVVVGSPAYMAPERVRAGTVTAQSDIWSVGVVLFEMLSGQLPFQGATNSALLAAIAADPPRPLSEVAPHLPVGIGAVVARCLKKRPADRYSSIGALADELREFVGDEFARQRHGAGDDTATISATMERSRAAHTGSRARRLRTGLLLLVVLGVGLLVAFLSQSRKVSPPSADQPSEPRASAAALDGGLPTARATEASAPSPAQVTSTAGEAHEREMLVPNPPPAPSTRPAAPVPKGMRVVNPDQPSRRQPAATQSASPSASASAASRLFVEPDF